MGSPSIGCFTGRRLTRFHEEASISSLSCLKFFKHRNCLVMVVYQCDVSERLDILMEGVFEKAVILRKAFEEYKL